MRRDATQRHATRLHSSGLHVSGSHQSALVPIDSLPIWFGVSPTNNILCTYQKTQELQFLSHAHPSTSETTIEFKQPYVIHSRMTPVPTSHPQHSRTKTCAAVCTSRHTFHKTHTHRDAHAYPPHPQVPEYLKKIQEDVATEYEYIQRLQDEEEEARQAETRLMPEEEKQVCRNRGSSARFA